MTVCSVVNDDFRRAIGLCAPYDFVFADVPYPGMLIYDTGSHKSEVRKGNNLNREFSNDEWFKVFGDLFEVIYESLADNAFCAVMANTKCERDFVFRLHESARKAGFRLFDMALWVKPRLVPSSCGIAKLRQFRQVYDPILVLQKGAPKFRSVMDPNCVSEFTGFNVKEPVNAVSTLSSGDVAYKAAAKAIGHGHPGRCPQSLVEYFLHHLTRPGDWVFDPFTGSGTTGAACKKLGRNFLGSDLNPKNVELAKAYIARIDPA